MKVNIKIGVRALSTMLLKIWVMILNFRVIVLCGVGLS